MKFSNFGVFAIVVAVVVILCKLITIIPKPHMNAGTYSARDMEKSYYHGFVNAATSTNPKLIYQEENDCYIWVESPWVNNAATQYNGCMEE